MTATFGIWKKRWLNKVMNVLGFDHPVYPKLAKGIEVDVKRKKKKVKMSKKLGKNASWVLLKL